MMQELKFSSHELKMITGDNQLTAAYIGQKLEFSKGPSLFASLCVDDGVITWNDIDEKIVTTTRNLAELQKLSSNNLLCIQGDVLARLISMRDHFACARLIKCIHLFARTSPSQKAIIVGMLNSLGHKTLMCGDGTNDVGSLKRADVGLAIVNNKEPSKEKKAEMKTMSMWVDKKKLEGKTW